MYAEYSLKDNSYSLFKSVFKAPLIDKARQSVIKAKPIKFKQKQNYLSIVIQFESHCIHFPLISMNIIFSVRRISHWEVGQGFVPLQDSITPDNPKWQWAQLCLRSQMLFCLFVANIIDRKGYST